MNIVTSNILKRLLNAIRYFFFFLGPGMLFHYIRKRKNWKRLEQYALDNKIERVLTKSRDDFGELHWEVDGRPVIARICYDNPSFGPWLSVGLKLDTDMLNLKTYRPMNRPNEGWDEFTSPDPEFNYLYRTRQVRSDYRRLLLDSPDIFSEIVHFCSEWMLYMSSDIGTNGLTVDGEEIRFIFGPSPIRSMFPYIRPEEIDAVLPDIIALADSFDSALAPGK
jgi:hypothetical protein